MFDKVVVAVMVASGLLTLSMLYAAFAPEAAMQAMFGETPEGAMASVVTRNWGVLIGLIGALLIYGAFHKPVRNTALIVAGASKLAFMSLVLAEGERYLSGLGVALVLDSVAVILFAVFLARALWRRA